MNTLYQALDYMKSLIFKFKMYIIAFSLGVIAVVVALIFGRKSDELKDAKVIKDIVMKDKKDILAEAIKNSESIIEKSESNIIYIEDKIKTNEASMKETEKEVMEEEDVRAISEGFSKIGN